MCVFSAGHMARRARPEGARELSPGFTPGLPWVSGNKRFALMKGLEANTIRSRGLELIPGPYLVAPSGLIRWGKITQGKPWAKLFWPLRATDWVASDPKDRR